jgi:hypothetical protein
MLAASAPSWGLHIYYLEMRYISFLLRIWKKMPNVIAVYVPVIWSRAWSPLKNKKSMGIF